MKVRLLFCLTYLFYFSFVKSNLTLHSRYSFPHVFLSQSLAPLEVWSPCPACKDFIWLARCGYSHDYQCVLPWLPSLCDLSSLNILPLQYGIAECHTWIPPRGFWFASIKLLLERFYLKIHAFNYKVNPINLDLTNILKQFEWPFDFL